MATRSLYNIYTSLRAAPRHLFVVPLIRYNFPATDYLALLYKPIEQEHPEISVHSTSALGHVGFVWAQLTGKQPILHYHWLEFQDAKSLLGIFYKILSLAFFKFFGGKLVWTVHNLTPHNKKWPTANKWIHQWMAHRSEVILVHTTQTKKLAADYLSVNSAKIEVYPHPPFPVEVLSKHDAILELEKEFNLQIKPSSTLFLMAGAVSGYKQIPDVIATLQSCSKNWQLLIAGYVKKDQNATHHQIHTLASNDSRILYFPTFIHEKHYPILFSAADVCLFNFNAILYSGGVEMAKSYFKKIIAPKIGGLVDLADEPSVQLFTTPKEFKQLLQAAIDTEAHG